jgi:hypothetical protein
MLGWRKKNLRILGMAKQKRKNNKNKKTNEPLNENNIALLNKLNSAESHERANALASISTLLPSELVLLKQNGLLQKLMILLTDPSYNVILQSLGALTNTLIQTNSIAQFIDLKGIQIIQTLLKKVIKNIDQIDHQLQTEMAVDEEEVDVQMKDKDDELPNHPQIFILIYTVLQMVLEQSDSLALILKETTKQAIRIFTSKDETSTGELISATGSFLNCVTDDNHEGATLFTKKDAERLLEMVQEKTELEQVLSILYNIREILPAKTNFLKTVLDNLRTIFNLDQNLIELEQAGLEVDRINSTKVNEEMQLTGDLEISTTMNTKQKLILTRTKELTNLQLSLELFSNIYSDFEEPNQLLKKLGQMLFEGSPSLLELVLKLALMGLCDFKAKSLLSYNLAFEKVVSRALVGLGNVLTMDLLQDYISQHKSESINLFEQILSKFLNTYQNAVVSKELSESYLAVLYNLSRVFIQIKLTINPTDEIISFLTQVYANGDLNTKIQTIQIISFYAKFPNVVQNRKLGELILSVLKTELEDDLLQEVLDAVFEVYGDEYEYDCNFWDLGFISVLKQTSGGCEEAMENLEGFIAYKEQNK